MDERKTREFTTPGGHTVVVKEYLTAREVNSVLTDLFKAQEVTPDAGSTPKISLALGVQRNVKLVEAAVISLDGSTDNLSDRLLDLPASEHTAILNEVKGLAEGNF